MKKLISVALAVALTLPGWGTTMPLAYASEAGSSSSTQSASTNESSSTANTEVPALSNTAALMATDITPTETVTTLETVTTAANTEGTVTTAGTSTENSDGTSTENSDGTSTGTSDGASTGTGTGTDTGTDTTTTPTDPQPEGDPTVTTTEQITFPTLSARAHIQNTGWSNTWTTFKEGSTVTLGTAGSGLRIEAMQYRLTAQASKTTTTTTTQKYSDGTSKETKTTKTTKLSGTLNFAAHVQNVGWQSGADANATGSNIMGSTGKSQRIEAVKYWLTGDLKNTYDIYYRTYVQNLGWLDWAKNGAEAGTSGQSLRVESVQIVIVKKGSKFSGTTTTPYVGKQVLNYRVHVQNIGDQKQVSGGATAGTTGKSLRLENIRISVPSNSAISGGVTYRTHVQNLGWLDWVSNGAESGTHGKSLRMEAISIKLTGNLAKYYDVYYRVHAQNYGWLGWAKNGADAGTSGFSYRLEALQVVLVAKGASAPGSTSNAYIDGTTVKNSVQRAMLNKIANKASGSQYYLVVDTVNCKVGVFKGSKGKWSLYKYYNCGPGTSSTPTVKGTFTVSGRGYSFGSGYTCYYYTQFYGNYLFHSVLYYQGTRKIKDGTLGKRVSHGCVRLAIENAKWIYDNVPNGTKVLVY